MIQDKSSCNIWKKILQILGVSYGGVQHSGFSLFLQYYLVGNLLMCWNSNPTTSKINTSQLNIYV